MKPVTKSVLLAVVVAAIVYLAEFAWQYSLLLAHQPGVAKPADVTGVPPSAAWLFAAPYAIFAHVGTFIVSFGAIRILRSGRNGSH